ncbi:hypothetical protein [Inquilinus sp. CAU 1745]|uniref:hypothetical protein n=1 Tax=Inquilinus sp. CAU 1745 TaxID=3140369 RepID=UPI00325C2377
MFLEKHSRFFRRYNITFAPRHKGAPYLPLSADPSEYSIRDALQECIDAEQAMDVQPNGDIIELMAVEHRPRQKALVMLFHRASPNAAEPAYRKKARAQAGRKVTVRESVKQKDEEQSVSAHLVIHDTQIERGVFRAALEEIPGISMSAARLIAAKALSEYRYDFERNRLTKQTYSVVKAEGLKSETLTNALKDGQINFITLVRPAKPDFIDSEGLFEPINEVMKIRVTGSLTSRNWRERILNLAERAKEDGWQDFNIDIGLEDNRKRTVKLDRDQQAKEILFVRSELVQFGVALPVCSVDFSDEVIRKATAIAKE